MSVFLAVVGLVYGVCLVPAAVDGCRKLKQIAR